MLATDPPQPTVDPALAKLAQPLRIRDVEIANRVLLAPMSGVSDRPFRKLASDAGAGLVVTEMVASELLVRGDAESLMRSEGIGGGPHVVQLAGREAHWMGEGARAAEQAGADIIDINMGCPAKKVTSGYSGSALMRDLDHALTLVEATVAATTRPVTLKMRLGWDERTINAPALARRAVDAGVALITVHGRTRCQFYGGSADWPAVAAVKDAIGATPLVVNGDIADAASAARAMAASGADAVMVGRAAYGRPWLPGAIAAAAAGTVRSAPPAQDVAALAAAHYEALLDQYGVAVGLRAARKHLGWYLDRIAEAGAPVAGFNRALIMTTTDPVTVLKLLRETAASPDRLAA